MNHNSKIPSIEPEDLFAEAVARLEAGEAIDRILASYPASEQAELYDLLSIVRATQEIRQAPVPPPSSQWRAASKSKFLEKAAEMRGQSANPAFVSAQAPKQAATRPVQFKSARPVERVGLLEGLLQRATEAVQSLFTVRTLRLAPLILLLAAIFLSTSSLVSVAQAAVPGDLAYTFKQWMRKQELEFARPEQREIVRLEHERELVEDVRKAAERADNNSAIIQAEDTQIFYGRSGRVLKIGGLTVLDRYQPDANVEAFEQMEIQGDLVPGALVTLIYQIMPGQSDTVQGIALQVVAPPSEEIIAEPAVLPADTPAVSPAGVACTVTPPEGWTLYQVRVGDNLTFLANRGKTTVQELMRVNCLNSETIWIGVELYIPATALEESETGRFCDASVPEGWVVYEVQPGDNLTLIALRSGATVEELMTMNCLTSADTIVIGTRLYVPETETAPTP